MMNIQPQYTFDQHGNPIGVFLLIDEWNSLTEELQMELPEWQKKLIDQRLTLYNNNPAGTLEWEVVLEQLDSEDEKI